MSPAKPAADDDVSKTYEEDPLDKIGRLERLLADERKFARKTTRQLHRTLLREVRTAERKATDAEKRAAEAEAALRSARRRAKQSDAELEMIKESTTWKAGKAVLLVPSRIRRWARP